MGLSFKGESSVGAEIVVDLTFMGCIQTWRTFTDGLVDMLATEHSHQNLKLNYCQKWSHILFFNDDCLILFLYIVGNFLIFNESRQFVR